MTSTVTRTTQWRSPRRPYNVLRACIHCTRSEFKVGKKNKYLITLLRTSDPISLITRCTDGPVGGNVPNAVFDTIAKTADRVRSTGSNPFEPGGLPKKKKKNPVAHLKTYRVKKNFFFSVLCVYFLQVRRNS